MSKQATDAESQPSRPVIEKVTIAKPNIKIAEIPIEGSQPFVQNKFSLKTREIMEARQREGSTGNKGKQRSPKEFEKLYQESMHRGPKGEYGIPASAFRAASISACRLVNFKMTLAKMSIFVVADFFDKSDGTPLVRLHGEPSMIVSPVRNDSGVVDLRARAMFAPGWRANVTIQFDADQFTLTDIFNLFERVGTQVGVGEGRNDSRDSHGCGWGSFQIVDQRRRGKA